MIRVGVAGWSYDDWKGRVYPRRVTRGFHPLELLARSFDCIEINSSFYGLPRPEWVRDWVRRVAERPHFRFAVKLHRELTHGTPADEDALAFRRCVAPLEEAGRLGAVLAQFHQDFGDDPLGRGRLEHVLDLTVDLPLVVELRHRSWFTTQALTWLAERGVNLAHVDMPASLSVVPQVSARADLPYFLGPLGYLRVHGRNAASWYDDEAHRDQKYDWLYTPDEARLFADHARKLAAAGGDTYVVTNNHFAGKAVVNGLEILAELVGAPVAGPRDLLPHYPHLKAILRDEGQGTLF